MIVLGVAGGAQAASFDHSALDALLKAHVKPWDKGRATRVDYDGFKRDRARLASYLEKTAAVSRATFDGWSKDEQLAFLINVYNAHTIESILTGYPGLKSIRDLGGVFASPWKREIVPLFGVMHSLDDVEHGMIRGSGRYNDPRIHFAVNCASIGCPDLRAEAYSGQALDRQLDEQTKLFLADRTRNRLNGQALEISSIFKWYGEDFETGFRGTNTIGAFLALYGEAMGLDATAQEAARRGDYRLRYLSYDWNLNGTK
ncbi:DUF547 domain-containing protein [Peteryoungia desertarenae]|uniref:DUF547 domain-containing protein n=2 Tax=Peteryoungia desertarenae TaxID=1813451 RepID=A0ABX6QS42_9HYPH|nr:DUF547 domain-containing protein [Peteryoungia desertarenae]